MVQCREQKMLRMKMLRMKMLRMRMRTRMKEEDRRLVLADSCSDPDPRLPQGRSHTWRRERPSWKSGSGRPASPWVSQTFGLSQRTV